MKVRIHRGAEEIGGICFEVEAQGQRIVLDLGRPLDAPFGEAVPLPPIAGLAGGDDPSLLGVFISHPHQDHWGLLPQIAPSIPVFMGEAASRILKEAAFFSPAGVDLAVSGFLRDREPLRLGPFEVTPFLVDHSAFDAYALLIDADGRRLFYTGDFRGHGRKAGLFKRLLARPPASVDLMLFEGTNVRPENEAARQESTEEEVERRCVETFKATPGLALVCYSAQNVDRMVTLCRAALQADRDFVMDLYTATIARATGRDTIPQPGPRWPRVKVFVPLRQRVLVKEAGEFERVEWVRGCRIFPNQLAELRGRLALTFRGTMARDLESAGCLEGSTLVWSLWEGYRQKDEATRSLCERHGVPVVSCHASGHASIADLRALVEAIGSRQSVQIHSGAGRAIPGTHAVTVENGATLEV